MQERKTEIYPGDINFILRSNLFYTGFHICFDSKYPNKRIEI